MSTGKILLVEDDKFSSRMMELQFRKHGYDLVAAENAKQALGQLEATTFDLVLTDVLMPDVSGIELVRKIRETYSREALPVVMLSGLKDEDRALASFQAGANDFVVKAKDFSLILAMVEPHLELKRLRERQPLTSQEVGDDAVWTWQVPSDTMTYSREWKTMLGLTGQDLPTSADFWRGRIHPDDRDRVEVALAAHQRREKSCFSADFRIAHGDGRYVQVHGFALAMFDKSGRAARMVGSLRRLDSVQEDPC